MNVYSLDKLHTCQVYKCVIVSSGDGSMDQATEGKTPERENVDYNVYNNYYTYII